MKKYSHLASQKSLERIQHQIKIWDYENDCLCKEPAIEKQINKILILKTDFIFIIINNVKKCILKNF